MQSRYFFDISRNIYQKKVSTLQYLLLFTIHSSTYFCFWFIKFIKFQSCNFLLTFFKLKPVFHRHKVFWCILILFYSCLLNAYYSCLLLHLMLIHAYYIYIYIYIYIKDQPADSCFFALWELNSTAQIKWRSWRTRMLKLLPELWVLHYIYWKMIFLIIPLQ